MCQLIKEPTRFRMGQEPSLLDLIITTDEHLINNIEIKAPLGKSDHVVLEFSVTNQNIRNEKNRNRLDIKRLNVDQFKAKMEEIC